MKKVLLTELFREAEFPWGKFAHKPGKTRLKEPPVGGEYTTSKQLGVGAAADNWKKVSYNQLPAPARQKWEAAWGNIDWDDYFSSDESEHLEKEYQDDPWDDPSVPFYGDEENRIYVTNGKDAVVFQHSFHLRGSTIAIYFADDKKKWYTSDEEASLEGEFEVHDVDRMIWKALEDAGIE